MRLRLDAAGVSDVGAHRAVNQDAAFTASWGAAVADGVGGGPAGDLASATLVHRLTPGRPHVEDADDLIVRLRGANWDLRARVERDPSLAGMATTFTGLFTTATGGILLAHSGDSRGYRLRDGVLSRETRDDSLVQELVDSGLITAADAASHPRRNIVTASLGGAEDDRIAVWEADALAGDRWLLCSDGLTDYVPEADVADVLTAGTPRTTASALVALALEAGTRDNVTAVVCDLVPGPPDRDAPAYLGAAAARFGEQLDSA